MIVDRTIVCSLLMGTAIFSAGCSADKPAPEVVRESLSPSVKQATVEMLLEDQGASRHPADGGGRAWLTSRPGPFVASRPARFVIVFEAGPLGIEIGGAVYLLPSPFWGWSAPQTEVAHGLGFAQVSTDSAGLELSTQVVDGQMLIIWVGGRALEPGERITIEYGAGESGALVDRFAESDSKLWIAVDGDGDGIRRILANSPSVSIVADRPARLVLTLPSVARPAEIVSLTLAWLDASANSGAVFVGDVELSMEPPAPGFPMVVSFESGDYGRKSLEFKVGKGGTFRIRCRQETFGESLSNPMLVSADAARVYWGDLHGHSGLSDGTGTPVDFYRYARDVAALDVVALTDHDHWGMLFLDESPAMWEEIKEETELFYDPGRFVTILGYEWTSWLHGHRHVLYFDGEGEVLSSIDSRYDTPAELWSALRGREALTVAHHTAGGPVATNWDYEPDPILEPLTEVVSVHGSSEAADSPGTIYSAVAGNFARDALDRGYRLGFLGSGDSHDGHPGLAHLSSGVGGLAGIITDDLTRPGVLAALRARRVYATNGPRILLRFAVNGHPMGSIVRGDYEWVDVFVGVVAVSPIERVDLIRSGEIAATASGEGRFEATLGLHLDGPTPGEYLYVRVVQEDGGAAWSSPIFFEE